MFPSAAPLALAETKRKASPPKRTRIRKPRKYSGAGPKYALPVPAECRLTAVYLT